MERLIRRLAGALILIGLTLGLLVLRGAEALRSALKSARDLLAHVVAHAISNHDVETIPGRAAATDEILGFAIRVHDDVKRSMMIDETSAKLGLTEDRVKARAKALLVSSRC